MKNLIITLLATSSIDSFNPIGITQQFVLQGMVKKPRHIWYFILTTGVVNMIFGYFVYYGVMSLISDAFEFVLTRYGLLIYALEMTIGILMLCFGLQRLLKIVALRNEESANQMHEEERIKSQIWSVTPAALIGIGVVSTASELTSALPYFAFLAVLLTYKLSFWILTLVLIFYNIIYIAPFMAMYFIYIISKKKFDSIYIFFKKHIQKFSPYFLPLLMLIVSVIIIFHSVVDIIDFV